MRNAFLGALCTLVLLIATTCTQKSNTTPDTYEVIVPPVPAQCIPIEKTKDPVVLSETEEYLSVDVMAEEIATVWELFFDDDNASLSDPRRQMFIPYAIEIAKWVDYWKKNEVDIGGRMPNHRNAHITIAIIITHESSVNPKVVGKKYGEVSMFQLHGKALNGYSREEVKRNTNLAAKLGVRWIAYSTSQCNNNRDPLSAEWEDRDWLRPLTIYGSGPKTAYKNKRKRTCRIFGFAKRRMNEIAMYQYRIDNEELL